MGSLTGWVWVNVKDGIKIALAVALIGLLGADIGLQTARIFGAPTLATEQLKPVADDGTKWTDRDQAYSSVAVAAFTLILLFASTAQWLAMRTQNKNLSSQLSLLQNAERPYLFIHKLSAILFDLDPNDYPWQYVSYTVANHGKTPAIIDFVRTIHTVSTDGPEEPTDDGDTHSLLIAPILASGEQRDDIRHGIAYGVKWKEYYDPESPDDNPQYPDGFRPILAESESLYMRITVGYHSTSATGYVTSACWKYDRYSGMFLGYGGSELNYVR